MGGHRTSYHGLRQHGLRHIGAGHEDPQIKSCWIAPVFPCALGKLRGSQPAHSVHAPSCASLTFHASVKTARPRSESPGNKVDLTSWPSRLRLKQPGASRPFSAPFLRKRRRPAADLELAEPFLRPCTSTLRPRWAARTRHWPTKKLCQVAKRASKGCRHANSCSVPLSHARGRLRGSDWPRSSHSSLPSAMAARCLPGSAVLAMLSYSLLLESISINIYMFCNTSFWSWLLLHDM